ncbi:MAG: S8 family serine peptidase, partial [Phycisphaerae bacterium]
AATEPNPALLIDALVAANGQTYVCSAGNAGPGANSLTPPASCYNTLAVAALAGPDYTAVAGFSSRGGSDYYNPVTRQTVAGARATVDLAAPGQMLLVATYNGAASAADAYVVGQGTSFASPLVAGGAALLVDVGYDRFGGGSAVDGRVVKSVLQNAARPTHGWDNGTRRGADGVWRTTQALDFAAGAGAVDLERGFHQFTDGTTDVPGLGGGEVRPTGWDFGRVDADGFVEYRLEALPAGTFRGTLNWWVRRSATFRPWGHDYDLAGAGDDSFVNLDLQLWRLTGDGPADRVLVGASESLYNNTELLAISLAEAGRYALRVLWAGVHYDRLGTADGVDFGLAWWGEPVPEPAGLVLILALTGRFVVPRRGPRKAS